MNKLLPALLIFCAVFSAFQANAGAKEDFEAFVNATRADAAKLKNSGVIMGIGADPIYKIIAVNFKAPAASNKLTPAVLQNQKNNMLKVMRTKQDDVRTIKRLNITIIYNLITTDNKIVSMPIYASDF